VAEPPLVEIRDLEVARDGRRAIHGVSLDVAPASIHLLVGPNGAGKSSLLAALLGLVEFSGTIRFHWRGSERIGYVPQSFAVDRTLPLTVGEFLALSRQRRPVALGLGATTRARVEALLQRVGLGGFAKRLLGALSGGELQKVLLANGLDPAPELLLLDEPSSGLDETSVREFEEIVVDLQQAGTSVLMVSHDLGQVRRIADRVTLLDKTVRRTGAPADVVADDLARSLAVDTGCAP
jgi:zinc transport system ATP-binding protein